MVLEIPVLVATGNDWRWPHRLRCNLVACWHYLLCHLTMGKSTGNLKMWTWYATSGQPWSCLSCWLRIFTKINDDIKQHLDRVCTVLTICLKGLVNDHVVFHICLIQHPQLFRIKVECEDFSVSTPFWKALYAFTLYPSVRVQWNANKSLSRWI